MHSAQMSSILDATEKTHRFIDTSSSAQGSLGVRMQALAKCSTSMEQWLKGTAVCWGHGDSTEVLKTIVKEAAPMS
jgi:hypothetical protein